MQQCCSAVRGGLTLNWTRNSTGFAARAASASTSARMPNRRRDWFAIHRNTAAPVTVTFTDPVTNEVMETVAPPAAISLQFQLGTERRDNRYLVMGDAATAGQELGYLSTNELIGAVGTVGLQRQTVYGFQRLHLGTEDALPDGMVRRWGNRVCRGTRSMPFEIEVMRFYQVSSADSRGLADYDLRRCDAPDEARPDHSSSLANGDGELISLTIEGRRRSFLIAVVAADHRPNLDIPRWSTFFVTEIVSGR